MAHPESISAVGEESASSKRSAWLKHYDPRVPASLSYPRTPLYTLLDESASRHPDQPCTRFFGKQLSYRQIQEYSNRFAVGVQSLGVAKGDRVVLLLPNSPQFIIAYFGLLKAGAVIVPLNPLSTERELTFHFSDSGAETVVTVPLFLEKVAGLAHKTPLRRIILSPVSNFLPFPLNLVQGMQERKLVHRSGAGEVVFLSDLTREPVPSDWSPQPVDPDEMAVLIYSGGTTGVAKGIMLSHFALVANAHQIVAWGSLSTEERILAVLPLFHGFGMSVTMNAPILAGGEIVLLPRFSARQVVQTIQKTKPQFFIGVPTMFVAFSNLPDIQRYDLSSLQGIFVGAAP